MPKPHSSANSLTPMATDTQAKIQQLQQEVLKEQTNIQQQQRRRNQSKFKMKTLIKKNIPAKQQNKINTAPFTVNDIQVKKFNIRHSNVTSGNVYDSAAEQQQQNIGQTKATLRKQAYVIQLGVFGNSDHADRLIAKLRRKGFNAFGYKQQIKHKILTHVYVGPMITRKRAKVMRSKLHKDMKIKGMITKFDATNLH
jgi:cell division septation protein DedD